MDPLRDLNNAVEGKTTLSGMVETIWKLKSQGEPGGKEASIT